jgi:hypothetical protein
MICSNAWLVWRGPGSSTLSPPSPERYTSTVTWSCTRSV